MINDRLIELAKQAGLKKDHGTDKEYIGDFDWREFGELIIRECITVMYDDAIQRKVPPDIDKTPLQYAIAIKDHFGVDK
jgi:hypothetical protein